jgi:tetratricopeptide (TPR) repeat protein
MKNLFCTLFLISIMLSCTNKGVEKKEVTQFINDAVKKAKTANKTLIIEFWSPECGPCIRLQRDIFNHSKTKGFLDSSFVLVQVSPADSIYKLLWKHFNLAYQSSVIYIDKNGNEIDRTVSYNSDRNSYLNFLKDVAVGKNLFGNILLAYQKDTLNVPNTYLMANKLFFRYQLKDAIKQYNKILVLDPDNKFGFNPECSYKIAESELTLTGNLDKMREFIITDLKDDFVPKAYEYLINDLINKGDSLSCITLCKEAFDKYPDSWEILNKYAWAICTFKIKNDYQKVLDMVQKSIELNPNRPGTYSTEAWIYFEMGNKEKAIEAQNKGIKIYPLPAYIQDLEKFKSM